MHKHKQQKVPTNICELLIMGMNALLLNISQKIYFSITCNLICLILTLIFSLISIENIFSQQNNIPKLRYQPVDSGYQIVGSHNIFNRGLYGGHTNDHLPEKYVTFASDQPLVMGVLSDWRNEPAGLQAKCGTFMAGFAYTPGITAPYTHMGDGHYGDRYNLWFHDAGRSGTVATYKNGWMEYELSPYAYAQTVAAKIEVLPITSEDGFLVHFKVSTDQRVNFVMGFGGVTDFIGRFEFPFVAERNFSPSDCIGNTVTIGKNKATIVGSKENSTQTMMRIGSSFPVNFQVGDAKKTANPGLFLQNDSINIEAPMVRMESVIMQGDTLDGYIVVLRNTSEAILDQWLSHPDPVTHLKNEIRKTRSAIEISTPDHMLDLTAHPTVLAMDASWHEKSFYHGTYAWHAPYMGWRLWYGPTVIGWHDRVQKGFKTHADQQVEKSDKKEEVVYTGGPYSKINNSYGYIPAMADGKKKLFYNMQEVGIDMILHNIEWTNDLSYAEEVFENITDALDWEERILDPDNDNLYQNWLNTWISDAHSYNGGGCAQASAYNYRANKVMANIASKLGHNPKPFLKRSENIRDAVQETLWIPEKGIMAEYIDVIGNKLIHPSPELATIYHSIESEIVDSFQAYQMLLFTENELRNEKTKARGGRMVWSSNWYPRNYSSCGLYTAENIHLAWAYYKVRQSEKGHELLNGIVDAHFLGRFPGLAGHRMAPDGYTDGSTDFTDISSMHLRLIVEGLFGIQFKLLDDKILIAPNFPSEWDSARLKVPDASIEYQREGHKETFAFQSKTPATRIFSVPLRSTKIERVLLNNNAVEYHIEPGIGTSNLIVASNQTGNINLEVKHAANPVPKLKYQKNISEGERIHIQTDRGVITEIKDPSGCLKEIIQNKAVVSAEVHAVPGYNTVFIRVKEGDWDGWLPADLIIDKERVADRTTTLSVEGFDPVDISDHFNSSLEEIHNQEYWKPRPEGYAIMANLNGRFGWDWNHGGLKKTIVNDEKLRNSGGKYVADNGIPFSTPEKGKNAACVSIWENFPEEISFDLSGKGKELAIFFIGVTNPMQSRVENARFSVEYTDGTKEIVSLVNPVNFDDWLVASVQQENETQYFSDYNHGIIQRIPIDPTKDLKALKVRAIANEVILGILGISINRY